MPCHSWVELSKVLVGSCPQLWQEGWRVWGTPRENVHPKGAGEGTIQKRSVILKKNEPVVGRNIFHRA